MKSKKQCKYCNKFFNAYGIGNHQAKCKQHHFVDMPEKAEDTSVAYSGNQIVTPSIQTVIDISGRQVEAIVDGVWSTLDLGQKIDILSTHFGQL